MLTEQEHAEVCFFVRVYKVPLCKKVTGIPILHGVKKQEFKCFGVSESHEWRLLGTVAFNHMVHEQLNGELDMEG